MIYRFDFYTHENIIFDRHIVSLLAYYIVNTKEEKEYISIRKLFTEFVNKYEGSAIFLLKASYSNIRHRLIQRKERGSYLSDHDMRVINDEQYYQKYSKSFDKLFSILRRINKRNNKAIYIKNIRTDDVQVNGIYVSHKKRTIADMVNRIIINNEKYNKKYKKELVGTAPCKVE